MIWESHSGFRLKEVTIMGYDCCEGGIWLHWFKVKVFDGGMNCFATWHTRSNIWMESNDGTP